MPNVALGKPILEETVRRGSTATNGSVAGYTGREGFADFLWPGTFTVDLGQPYDIVAIRVLLSDGLGSGRGVVAPRSYHYRLLTSVDDSTWHVEYDTGTDGSNGWQVHNFDPPRDARYVRIHGLWDSAHERFHIVELEAHDAPPPALNRAPSRVHTIRAPAAIEIGSGMPAASQLQASIVQLEAFVEQQPLINREYVAGIISRLRTSVIDIGQLEASVDAIRRQILLPVQEELERGAKLSRFSVWGFWVGIIGGLLAIIALALQIATIL